MDLYDKDRICVKCCDGKASTQFCRGIAKAKDGSVCNEIYMNTDTKHSTLKSEHMARVCKQCGYTWLERPIDAGAPLEQLAAQAGDKK